MVTQTKLSQQFCLLLWKNFTLRRRHPVRLVVELLLPLFFIIILAAIRTRQLKYQYDRCYLREKQLPSMGPLQFAQGFVCTFNTTCYTGDQDDWTGDQTQNLFLAFIQNATDIINSFPPQMNSTMFSQWAAKNPILLQELSYSFSYFQIISSTLLPILNGISSSQGSLTPKLLAQISSLVCGTVQSDALSFLIPLFQANQSTATTCQDTVQWMFKNNPSITRLYPVIIPLLFGQIYYTPSSTFTTELIRRANHTFRLLDNMRQAAIQWRISFVNVALQNLLGGSLLSTAQSACAASNGTLLYRFCQGINVYLNQTTLNSLATALTMIFGMIETALNCTQLNKFVPVPSADYFNNLNLQNYDGIFAGIVFDPSFQYLTVQNASFLNYTIRVPPNRIDTTVRNKVLDSFWTPIPRTSTLTTMNYYTSGFLFLQQAIDEAFIEMLSNNVSVTIGASVQIMPYPCYLNDRYIQYLSNLLPFLFVISWATPFIFLMKSIVYEKEKRLKEFMRVMGMSNFVHWAAWFMSFFIIMLVSVIVITILLKALKVLEYSAFGVIFILLLSYAISIICQSFMLSVFFSQSNIASIVGGIIYFILYLPYIVISQNVDSIAEPVYYGSGISAQVSLANALMFIANWEQETTGVQFSNLFSSTMLNLNFGVGHCMIMLWIDCIIYLLITWYVEAVFPGEYGVPRPWYFLFTESYWYPNGSCLNRIAIAGDCNGTNLRSEQYCTTGMEAEPTDLPIGISIEDLSKVFSKSKTAAVDKLNLNFYKSQITAFLGHNGAGKTTTISILTGIYPPTSGTAIILQKDIRSQMDSIRDVLGLCPQHNILFDMLTVEDHVYFYGMLKGMSKDAIRIEIPKIVGDVGLTKKGHSLSKMLSGGMKRKLSIAMAFVGDSKVVFLDEPTAGVDPFARRGIWDLLIKYRRSDRTIVLTTHHMDEADYLSDRIAIISQGKLKCCGSSVFLKKEFGDGYYLIFEKGKQAKEEDFSKISPSKSSESTLVFVRNYVSNAQITEETRTQLTIVLPFRNDNGNEFSVLFKSLDDALDKLNMASYGLSDTTLEEVFLKVADDPNKAVDNGPESLDLLTDAGDFPRPASRWSLRDKDNHYDSPPLPVANDVDIINYDLLKGFSLFKQQILALEIKRFHYTKRNIKGFVSELILPVCLILIIIIVLQTSNRLIADPPMTIHPWLMMPLGRNSTLYTFYRFENVSDALTTAITNQYTSDLGESGIRCVSQSIFNLSSYPCYSSSANTWSALPAQPIPLQSPDCSCNQTGMQQCTDPTSGGPTPSSRLMASSDLMNNLTGYNISDHLIKKFMFYKKHLYGGFQYLLNDSFGQVSNILANSALWTTLSISLNVSQNSSSFLSYMQQFFNMSGKKTTYVRIWVNSKGYISMPAYSNIFDNLLLRSRVQSPNDPSIYGIVVATYPLKYPQVPTAIVNSQLYLEMTLALFLNFALSLIPASFVIFLVEENVTGSKRQQLVSGVNPYIYWLATFFWDIIKYLIPMCVILIIIFAFNFQSYTNPKNVGAFVIILILYGFAILPHMYSFTFLFKVPSTAFVVLYSYNVLMGSVTSISTFILDVLQQSDSTIQPINDALKQAFLLWPQYDLSRGMLDLSSKYLTYNISGGLVDYNMFDWNNAGEKICSLCILFVSWSLILCLIESGLFQRTICGKIKNSKIKKKEVIVAEDEDVSAERSAVESGSVDDFSLRVINLTKIYNASIKTTCCGSKTINDAFASEQRKLAVNNITFGVRNGECFGLLGVNGAGKTTTFKMLTGEEDITFGESYINGKSIITDMVAAHKDMGFCPQFDALHHLLTCEEELYLYCRIRGIPSNQLKETVLLSMEHLSLTPHSQKVTSALSGGNKRKLSTAIALIGNPKVIFLDEPTAGMDAGARRFLWNRIRSLTGDNNHSVVLTSHNMEECEVLCHRLCIMVNGEMKCIGSVQGLKSKFGSDYQIKVRLLPNVDGESNRENVKTIVKKEFNDLALIQDENFITIVYRINQSRVKLHTIFDVFENMKKNNVISDFSISQTSLDEVFIHFAKSDPAYRKSVSNFVQNTEVTGHENPSYMTTPM